ncbi:MAG: hypothetical protein IE909_13250 [Campylobacterales bacterium]|nr:hypothetical protein [Campylobacterales bacterium]
MKSSQASKQLKILLLTIYAVVMLGSIWSDIDMLLFVLVFVLAPIGIYLFVLKIYPKIDKK